MPTVEDYFDDDTDLPLPSSSKPRALPNTGHKGALLEEIDDEADIDFELLAEQGRTVFGEGSKGAPPLSAADKGKMSMRQDPGEIRPTGPAGGGGPRIDPNTPMGGFMGDMLKLQQAEDERMEKLRKQFGGASVQDPGMYKAWNCVYPLYFDAKVSITDGRRVPRQSSVWWPQATQIAQACRSLGLPSVLEPDRCHPADWENPGRVKVQFVRDGKFMNPIVKNRTQLYKHLADQIRQQNPSVKYTPRPKTAKPSKEAESSTAKSKKAKSKANAKAKSAKAQSVPILFATRPPLPPQPVPTLEDRLPLHSPVHPTGVALASIKRDIETEKENKKKGITPGPSAEEGGKEKQPKVKRIMVRGKR